MAEVVDIFFRWTGIVFWMLAIGIPAWAFFKSLLELFDYLRWTRFIYGKEKATLLKLAAFGWQKRGDFLPFGRHFTSTSVGSRSWHGFRDWR